MNGSELFKINHKKDLGATICNDLKPVKYCSDIVTKANKLVGFLERNFEYKSEKRLFFLYH